MGLSWEEAQQLVGARYVEKYDWRALNTGESASQAKVSKAHAVPHSLSEILINALKLLANQQEDGDSPMQTVLTGLCERSRKGFYGGLEKLHKSGQSLCLGSRSSEGRFKVF